MHLVKCLETQVSTRIDDVRGQRPPYTVIPCYPTLAPAIRPLGIKVNRIHGRPPAQKSPHESNNTRSGGYAHFVGAAILDPYSFLACHGIDRYALSRSGCFTLTLLLRPRKHGRSRNRLIQVELLKQRALRASVGKSRQWEVSIVVELIVLDLFNYRCSSRHLAVRGV